MRSHNASIWVTNRVLKLIGCFFYFCLTETREAVIEVGHCQKWCQTGPASDAQGQSPVTATAH